MKKVKLLRKQSRAEASIKFAYQTSQYARIGVHLRLDKIITYWDSQSSTRNSQNCVVIISQRRKEQKYFFDEKSQYFKKTK